MSRNNTTKRRKKAKDDASDVFTHLQERIDVAKLKYVMRHYTEYKDVLNLRSDRHADNVSTSPHVLNMRYLARCDAKTGVLRVRYRQRDGKGDSLPFSPCRCSVCNGRFGTRWPANFT